MYVAATQITDNSTVCSTNTKENIKAHVNGDQRIPLTKGQ